MKANELMIGDWVKFPIGNERIIDLPYIPGMGICASFAASATLFPVEVEKLQPISLTPEILKKNGFKDGEFFGELMYEEWQILCDCAHLAMRSSAGWLVDIPSKFVHDLQHALRLCGIEKEVVL